MQRKAKKQTSRRRKPDEMDQNIDEMIAELDAEDQKLDLRSR